MSSGTFQPRQSLNELHIVTPFPLRLSDTEHHLDEGCWHCLCADPESKFSKALSLVPMFRRINEEHSKALSAMKMQSPDAFDQQFPPIHKELYTPEAQ